MNKLYKKLKTDANTFWGFILTLICIYLAVDRTFEMILMITTGVGYSYWGMLTYALVFLLPFITFKIMIESKFLTHDNLIVSLFVFYGSLFAIYLSSFASQLINQGVWLMFLSVPGYEKIVHEDLKLVKAAFTALSLLVPFYAIDKVYFWFRWFVVEDDEFYDGLVKQDGFKLGPSKKKTGPYSFEAMIARDMIFGNFAVMSEEGRFQHTLVVGPTGSGKTALYMEPMIAKDIEKKFFFRNAVKSLGHSLLKANIANIKPEYQNLDLNSNFTLDMLEPRKGREKLFHTYLAKIKTSLDENDMTAKDLGIVYLASEIESIEKLIKVADNYGVNYKLVDAINPEAYGINPFSNPDPEGAAMAVSMMVNSMIDYSTGETMVKQNFDATRAVENVAIILRVAYKKKYGAMLPTLEDVYKLLSNFDLIQVMVEELKEDEDFVKEHAVRIAYFEKNFYKNSPGREQMEGYVEMAVALLENFLTNKNMRNMFTNRYHNIDFDQSLRNGDVIFICTRRGRISGTAYDLFHMYMSIMLRFIKGGLIKKVDVPGAPLPYFMYIDDFGPFLSDKNAEMFSMGTRGNVGISIAVNNLEEIKKAANYLTYLNALRNRVIMAGLTYPECKFWATDDFPVRRVWSKVGYSTDDSSVEKMMDEDGSKAHLEWIDTVNPGEMFVMKFKSCAFRVKNTSGRYTSGMGKLDFIDQKHLVPAKEKSYNFNIYSNRNKDSKSSSKFASPFSKGRTVTSVDDSPDSFADDDTDILNNDEVSIDPIKYNPGLYNKKKKNE